MELPGKRNYYVTFKRILETVHASGHKLTRQREIVIQMICKLKIIDDVEQIWLRLKDEFDIALATIYSTIKLLCSLGLMGVKYQTDTRKRIYRLANR
ncbi:MULTISPECIES: transcriptional repressor [unclassified Sphingobacterium]|uniref:transcriptional repressor n=1 Tax=unclassified Sphingobacterium TaxID=2609468 RepID=UPI0025F30ECA|nr:MULTISPECIES: transcriptional repressor [unclassified Sphingobacterium]